MIHRFIHFVHLVNISLSVKGECGCCKWLSGFEARVQAEGPGLTLY